MSGAPPPHPDPLPPPEEREPSASEAGEGRTGHDAIDVRGLTKRYGTRTVVDDVSIRVPRGLIFGFLGPNGSGKTTTIRMLCGLLTPDAGEGTCLGYDLRTQAAAIKREVGYMTQRFSLYEDLSIEENLDFVARMYAVRKRRERRQCVKTTARLKSPVRRLPPTVRHNAPWCRSRDLRGRPPCARPRW